MWQVQPLEVDKDNRLPTSLDAGKMAVAILVDKRNQNGTNWIKKDRTSRLLFLYSCQPSPHICLMLFMEVAKEVARFDRLNFQPRKMARWIAEDFIG
jgi:hypothetical protein